MLFQDLGTPESWHPSLHSPSLLYYSVSKLHSLEGAGYGVSISLQVATSQDCFSLMCEASIEILKTASVLVRRRALQDEFLSLRTLPIMTPPEAMLMLEGTNDEQAANEKQEKRVDMHKDKP